MTKNIRPETPSPAKRIIPILPEMKTIFINSSRRRWLWERRKIPGWLQSLPRRRLPYPCGFCGGEFRRTQSEGAPHPLTREPAARWESKVGAKSRDGMKTASVNHSRGIFMHRFCQAFHNLLPPRRKYLQGGVPSGKNIFFSYYFNNSRIAFCIILGRRGGYYFYTAYNIGLQRVKVI